MKITHNKVGQNLNTTDQFSKSDKATDSSKAKGTQLEALSTHSQVKQAEDVKNLVKSKNEAVQLDLSDRAKDIKQAKDIALATPDVDMDKVEKFRKLIDDGKYKVDAQAVADRMINDGLLALGQSNND